MMTKWINFDAQLAHWLRYPQDLLLVLLRLAVAWVFFKSGMLKLQSWDSTLELFAYEYAVPFLSPLVAAVAGTAGELLLPPLLAIGILTRPAAFALFVFNWVALISYPDISPAGIKDHQLWGLGLACVFLFGAGAVSLDHWIARRLGRSTRSVP